MSGMPSGRGSTQEAGTTVSSAKAATFSPGWSSVPSVVRAYTSAAPLRAFTHSHTSPSVQG